MPSIIGLIIPVVIIEDRIGATNLVTVKINLGVVFNAEISLVTDLSQVKNLELC